MRRLGSVPDRDSAERLRDYLYANGISTQVDRNGGEWVIWIHEEDRIAQAREEFQQFQSHPDDPKYGAARDTAEALRNQRADEAIAARKRQILLSRRWQGMQSQIPVTALLIGLSIWVAILTRIGMDRNAIPQFQIADWQLDEQARRIVHDTLWEVLAKRQFHRWITPIFLHFGPFHLLFNMSALYAYGRVIEQRSGSLRFLGIVVVIALLSNFAQFVMKGPTFGGMSGVDFGLFGFLWMKSRFAPEYGVALGRDYVIQSLFFLVLCLTGALGPIANWVHFVGLFAGMALAMIPLIPRIWRQFKK